MDNNVVWSLHLQEWCVPPRFDPMLRSSERGHFICLYRVLRGAFCFSFVAYLEYNLQIEIVLVVSASRVSVTDLRLMLVIAVTDGRNVLSTVRTERVFSSVKTQYCNNFRL